MWRSSLALAPARFAVAEVDWRSVWEAGHTVTAGWRPSSADDTEWLAAAIAGAGSNQACFG
jgi:hypothetical protein